MQFPDIIATESAIWLQLRKIKPLANLWRYWVRRLPTDPQVAPFMFAAGDAADDFEVSIFNAVHGYYRQGLANLRSAIETVTIAARFAQKNDAKGLERWLNGKSEPKFGNARDIVARVLGAAITEVLDKLYHDLSNYIHTGPGGSKVTLWNGSNGPVWEPDSFTLVYRTFRDVMGMALVMLAIGWPAYSIPRSAWPMSKSPDGEAAGEGPGHSAVDAAGNRGAGHATTVTHERPPDCVGHQARSASGGRSYVTDRHAQRVFMPRRARGAYWVKNGGSWRGGRQSAALPRHRHRWPSATLRLVPCHAAERPAAHGLAMACRARFCLPGLAG